MKLFAEARVIFLSTYERKCIIVFSRSTLFLIWWRILFSFSWYVFGWYIVFFKFLVICFYPRYTYLHNILRIIMIVPQKLSLLLHRRALICTLWTFHFVYIPFFPIYRVLITWKRALNSLKLRLERESEWER